VLFLIEISIVNFKKMQVMLYVLIGLFKVRSKLLMLHLRLEFNFSSK